MQRDIAELKQDVADLKEENADFDEFRNRALFYDLVSVVEDQAKIQSQQPFTWLGVSETSWNKLSAAFKRTSSDEVHVSDRFNALLFVNIVNIALS